MVGRIQAEIKYLFIILNLLYVVSGCKPERNTADLFFYQTDSLQAGDVILRRSFGMVSDIIVSQLNDSIDVSHCGIVTKNSAGDLYIIHSLSKMVSDFDGIQICSLQKFMSDSRIESVRVFRFKTQKSACIADLATHYLTLKIPFDDKFDQNDSTAFYCSELPIHIIRRAFNIDISQNAHKPKFSVFVNPNYFNEVSFVYKKSPADD